MVGRQLHEGLLEHPFSCLQESVERHVLGGHPEECRALALVVVAIDPLDGDAIARATVVGQMAHTAASMVLRRNCDRV